MAIPGEMNDDALKKRLKVLDDRVKDGTILDASEEDLTADLHALCEERAACIFTAREINKGFLVSSLLMEHRTRRTNKLIIVLAIVGIIGTFLQLLFAFIDFCRASG
jgi:hypothetical protein